MRFLVDNALSFHMAEQLHTAGHDAIHVRDVGLATAEDNVILAYAARDDRILVSADTDFGALLAFWPENKPSFILFRRTDRRPEAQAQLILANLPAIQLALEQGAVVVFDQTRIRIRTLPYTR
jgi:predicted nuclease of predicted toxin-antitoxin system